MIKAKQHPKRLAEKLRAIRQGLSLSQNQLIKQMNFEDELIQSHISAYEAKKHNRIPPVGVILQYSRISGIPLENIIDDELELPPLPEWKKF